jgi:Mg-chelatase subunit ChlD
MAHDDSPLAARRWRLALGRFAEEQLADALGGGQYAKMDRVLQYLYGREYEGRGVRGERGGDLSAANLTVPGWIREARELFPTETMETLERHALNRYGMTELVTDPQVLERLEPSYDLLKAVLTFRGLMKGPVLEAARRIVRRTVDELTRRLARQVRPVLWGRLNRQQRTPLKSARNLDWQRTVRANLKHYDPERQRLVLEQLFFASRTRHHLPWHIIMAVDCSGSMLDSVIHSAVMASIFSGLPSVRVSLVAFDTSVIDLTGQVSDPLEVLMSVQLGGGTDICGALGYCETLVESPTRTVVILVTDFFEGNSPHGVVLRVKRLREAGARVLGLAALDEHAKAYFDHELAQRCVDAGAEVAALTPQRLAEWLDKVFA